MEELDLKKARVTSCKSLLSDAYIRLGEVIQEKDLSAPTTQGQVDLLVEEEVLRDVIADLQKKLEAFT